MNYQTIHQTCPKAFIEYIESRLPEKPEFPYKVIGYPDPENPRPEIGLYLDHQYYGVKMLDEVYKIPYYFFKFGIWIETNTYFQGNQFIIGVQIKQIGVQTPTVYNSTFGWSQMHSHITHNFDDPLLALEAGIVKAFEIREEQLNKTKTEN